MWWLICFLFRHLLSWLGSLDWWDISADIMFGAFALYMVVVAYRIFRVTSVNCKFSDRINTAEWAIKNRERYIAEHGIESWRWQNRRCAVLKERFEQFKRRMDAKV